MNLFNNQAATQLESFNPDKKLSYGIYSNGLWRRIKTPLGHFTHKVKDLSDNMGLTQQCEFNFEKDENIPKIPISIYKEILKFYKEIYKTIKSEVFTCVVWDKEKQDFFIHVPKQRVSGAQVDFENESEIISNPNYVPYLETHSHCNFSAFFSGGDVKDEVSGKFFGVIGHVDKEQEANVFKVAYNRQYKDLVLEDIFDMELEAIHPNSNYSLNFEEVSKNITERVVIPKVYNYPSVKQTNSKITEIGSRHKYPSNYGQKKKSLVDYREETMYEQVYSQYDLPWLDDIDFDLYEDSILNYIDTLPSEKIFKYDFEQVFSGSSSDKNLLNIYDSFTKLIIESGAECSELTLDLIQANIKASFKNQIKNV